MVEVVGESRLGIEARKLLDGVDEFVDIRTLVDAFVRIVRIRLFHLGIGDNLFHELVDGHTLTIDDPFLDQVAEGDEF